MGLKNSLGTRVTKPFSHSSPNLPRMHSFGRCNFQEFNLFGFCHWFVCLFPSQRDFLSLELVDGKVRLTVDLGSGPLALTTENRYNDGTWYKISFSRNKKQGRLRSKRNRCLHIYKYLRYPQGTSLQPNLVTSNAVSLATTLMLFCFMKDSSANLVLALTHFINSK